MSADAYQPLLELRQHQRSGQRSPHKPLLVLLALGRFVATGSSRLVWSDVNRQLADLISDFGPPSRTGASQSAAYPFTRLRGDGVWTLDRDVPMDQVSTLSQAPVAGRFTPVVERALGDRATLDATARAIVESEFPPSVASDVLIATGLDPDEIYAVPGKLTSARRRSGGWPAQILGSWDRKCAFCGYDGQLGSGCVGLEAAHVRWFNFGGPDDLDNGLALCSLHHKLFDRGALGLTTDYRVRISAGYTARTVVGRQVYDLADRELQPRRGTALPAPAHLDWHNSQVFKGPPLAA